MEGFEHRTTKIATPRANGFVERMNRTLRDECFRVAGRQTWHITSAEIQRDLDAFLRDYNLERHTRAIARGPNTRASTTRFVGRRHPAAYRSRGGVTNEIQPDTLAA